MSSASTIVLITGANSGVGYAASQVIASASENYNVIMAGRSLEKCKAALAEIQATGVKGSLSTLQLDVTDQASIEAAAKQVEDQFGRLDALVNNAGIAPQGGPLRTQLETTFATNTIGAALVSEAFKPLLLKSKNPYLLHIGSGLGSLGMASNPEHPDYNVPYPVYRMSKAALNMLAIQDWKELGKRGVKVFLVCPGLVRSNLRGTAEEQISAGGRAISADTSGRTILKIIEGKRDADVGKFVHQDGVYPW